MIKRESEIHTDINVREGKQKAADTAAAEEAAEKEEVTDEMVVDEVRLLRWLLFRLAFFPVTAREKRRVTSCHNFDELSEFHEILTMVI